MANNYVQMEVLLMTGTSFLAGNWTRKVPIDPRLSLKPSYFLSFQVYN
jgi:hypothetical protein